MRGRLLGSTAVVVAQEGDVMATELESSVDLHSRPERETTATGMKRPANDVGSDSSANRLHRRITPHCRARKKLRSRDGTGKTTRGFHAGISPALTQETGEQDGIGPAAANSEIRDEATYGVLRLALLARQYVYRPPPSA